MAKRLPRPGKPTRQRCEIDESELRLMEAAAHRCRLSVASWIRVALVGASESVTDDQVAVWDAIAERIRIAAPPDRAKPGRPKPKRKKGADAEGA